MPDTVQIDDAGRGVFTLCLNRPPVNALTAGFMAEIRSGFDDLAVRRDVRAVLITSKLNVLSGGLDLRAAQDFNIDQQNAVVEGLNETFRQIYGFPKPVGVAANGAAIAGGLFFVLSADFRIAAEGAKFGLAEVRVGANFPVGPLEVARDTLTPADLRRLMLSGQPINADRALAAGIVDQVVPADRLMDVALEQAQAHAKIPPQTYASVKLQIRGGTLARIEAAIAAGANSLPGGWFNDETRAAMAAMIGGGKS